MTACFALGVLSTTGAVYSFITKSIKNQGGGKEECKVKEETKDDVVSSASPLATLLATAISGLIHSTKMRRAPTAPPSSLLHRFAVCAVVALPTHSIQKESAPVAFRTTMYLTVLATFWRLTAFTSFGTFVRT